jgi:hypothetical protein
LERHRCLCRGSDDFVCRGRTRSNDQTIKASNPAKKKPPSSIDQSPVSNPRSRPSPEKRSVAERNMADAFFVSFDVVSFDRFLSKHAK